MERLLFNFLPLGVMSGLKSPCKKKNYTPDNETCVRGRYLFLQYLF